MAHGVYIVADDGMGPEDMEAIWIRGLVSLTSVTGGSWVVLMKTRKGNAKFWKWLVNTVSLPFMKDSMEHDRSEQAVLDMDGEFEQIEA